MGPASQNKEQQLSMRVAALLTGAAMAVVVTAVAGSALALPSVRPDSTPMVDGRVNAIEQVGNNVWVGGQFTQVQRRDGSLVEGVQNVAVFDSETGEPKDIALPALGGTGSRVMEMDAYTDPATGGEYVAIAGKFDGPTGTKKNLLVVDGTTGEVVRWHNAPTLEAVLAAPALGRIYGGGLSLSAFDIASTQKLWTRAKTSVDPNLRVHVNTGAYKDLELDGADGSTLWAACVCDFVEGTDGVARPAKALVKLSPEGVHDASWVATAGTAAFGVSLVDTDGALYLDRKSVV